MASENVNPADVRAIADWLDLMIKNEPSLRLCIYPNGKQKEISKRQMVKIVRIAAKQLERRKLMASENENESIESIVAEMRHGLDKSWHDIDREWARGLPARIEAAWKREAKDIAMEHAVLPAVCITKPSSNAAATREALLEIETVAGEAVENGTMELPQYSKIVDIAESALSAPARNCDVGTAEEQEARFVAWRYSDPLRAELGLDALEWAQMPYEAEEGDVK